MLSNVILVIFDGHLSDRIKYFVSQNEILLVLTDRLNKTRSQPIIDEPRREKTGLRAFRPGPTQTGRSSHRS